MAWIDIQGISKRGCSDDAIKVNGFFIKSDKFYLRKIETRVLEMSDFLILNTKESFETTSF